ncbi:AraC family transcriptional regulator [Aestuariibaculum suncheonense]|uniref:Helix-turn-helix transcriptional regulator n=1 Tax=Aestuariibaculum suncheonense TaxID=1028745 RepID=A0A8J6QAI1_9FLAO|nr:AraC family transcriptional regulator [Aestuariibaculum suncheonense]MBD0834200.1 helix-turn-helix transcriptional regulator [Aestuariibaculum suncheonense]
MKLHLIDRSTPSDTSFTAKVHEGSNFLKLWHYHPELELVVILKSDGNCFVGDGIEKFEVGDVFLIGKNTPHMWLNHEAYFDEASELIAKSVAIHFKKEFLGDKFFETPEMQHVSELFDRARFGIKFLNLKEELLITVQNMLSLDGFHKTITFLNILNTLSAHKDFKLLASSGYMKSFKVKTNKTLDKVYAYIFKNFNKNLSLEEVAKIANMNATAFSRLFKRVNGKPFSRYVAEIRIGYACKLLLEQKVNISQVCYEVGFNNISNFNRQFKMIMGCNPSEYIKQHVNSYQGR